MTKFALICRLSPLIVSVCCFGAEFKNLSFDDADTSRLQPGGFERPSGQDYTTNLLPGWKLSGPQQDFMYVNVEFDGSVSFASLQDSFGGAYLPPGQFALELYRPYTNPPPWKIEQTGTVPATARFLTYWGGFYELQVEVNGQVIEPLNPQVGGFIGSPTNLLFNVSQFAGQDVTLAFAGPFGNPDPFGIFDGFAYIDNIRFVSEPPTLAISRSGNQVVVSWSAAAIGYVLYSGEQASGGGAWSKVTAAPVFSGDQQSVTVNVGSKNQFYRLGLDTG
jgi:hypothetical protein